MKAKEPKWRAKNMETQSACTLGFTTFIKLILEILLNLNIMDVEQNDYIKNVDSNF